MAMIDITMEAADKIVRRFGRGAADKIVRRSDRWAADKLATIRQKMIDITMTSNRLTAY